MLAAARISLDSAGRYLYIPTFDRYEARAEEYRDMSVFVATVEEPRLRKRLSDPVEGRGAFRRFREILGSHAEEEKRWYEFSAERGRQRVLQWLESQGIEAVVE